jgi:hypothetical protein
VKLRLKPTLALFTRRFEAQLNWSPDPGKWADFRREPPPPQKITLLESRPLVTFDDGTTAGPVVSLPFRG